jgi:2-(1,2-epoxy-1,2-dihydrophenyl)acetyl-CoA isomerase
VSVTSSSGSDGVLTVTFDRPQRRNALDRDAIAAFVSILESAATDDSLRVIHLTAVGDDFCSGSDWVSSNTDGAPRPRAASLVRRLPLGAHRVIELLTTIQLPVVATVRGNAAGFGCQMALAADFTVADETARLWEPFVQRGFTPDTGATWLLPRLVGLARARSMLMLGEAVSGEQAAEWGLIHKAVPTGELEDASSALIAKLLSSPTVALGLIKQLLISASDASLPQAMNDEAFALELAARTADFREGLAAFTQRREPNFEGK